MRDFSPVYSLLNVPAAYALYGGHKGKIYVAYVGITGRLKQRITEHLIRQDSSVAIDTSAVILNPNYVTKLRWWEHPDFRNPAMLKAAEVVAFDVLNPVLNSRGRIDKAAQNLLSKKSFVNKMRNHFENSSNGSINFYSLTDAMDRIKALEKRIDELTK